MPWAEMIVFGSPIFPAPRFGEAEEQRQLLVLRLRERQGRQLWQSKNSVYHRGSVSVAGPHNVYHESCGKLHSDWKYQAELGTEGKLIGSGNDIWRLGNLAIALTHVHMYIYKNMVKYGMMLGKGNYPQIILFQACELFSFLQGSPQGAVGKLISSLSFIPARF